MSYDQPKPTGLPAVEARIDPKITYVEHNQLGTPSWYQMFTMHYQCLDDHMDRPFDGYFQVVKAHGISKIIARLFPRKFHEVYVNGIMWKAWDPRWIACDEQLSNDKTVTFTPVTDLIVRDKPSKKNNFPARREPYHVFQSSPFICFLSRGENYAHSMLRLEWKTDRLLAVKINQSFRPKSYYLERDYTTPNSTLSYLVEF